MVGTPASTRIRTGQMITPRSSVLPRLYWHFAAVSVLTAGTLPSTPSANAQAATTAVSYRVVRNAARGDTLNATVVLRNAVNYDGAASAYFGPGGTYKLRWHGDAFGIRNGAMLHLVSATLQQDLDAALSTRPAATTTITDPAVRSLPNFPAAADRPLIAAQLPFEIVGPGGQRADAVMLARHSAGNAADSLVRNTRLFGLRADTVRVRVPPDAWLPGDTLYVVENLPTGRAVTARLVLACATTVEPARNTCNPLALGTTGATGYLPLAAGYESVWRSPATSSR